MGLRLVLGSKLVVYNKVVPERQERRTCTSCQNWDIPLLENAFYTNKILCMIYDIPDTWKSSLDKNFANPRYLCIAEILGGINFRQCSKDRHIFYVIINTGQKIHVIKISPMRADGEIGKTSPGENFRVYGSLVIPSFSILHAENWDSLGMRLHNTVGQFLIASIYCHSLTKKGPWAVHLTLGSTRGVGQHSSYQYCVLLSARSGANSARHHGLSTLY